MWIYEKGQEESTKVAYEEFVKKPWRTYIKMQAGKSTEIPKSTFTLPLTYFKWVNAKHLGSIADEGLCYSPNRVVFMGMSARTDYVNRDLHIAGIWLATGDDTGDQFKVDKDSYLLLAIRVNRLFRDCYLRNSGAVLQGKEVDFDSSSDNEMTVISFADIPPDCIYCTVTEKMANQVKKDFDTSKLTAGTRPLSDLGSDLSLVIKMLQELAKNKY